MNAKNKALCASLVLILGGYQTLQANTNDDDENYTTLSVHNKSKNLIWLEVNNGTFLDEPIKTFRPARAVTVLAGAFHDYEIDTSLKTELTIYKPDGTVLYRATFPIGKTIYVKWDGKKLLPQMGGGFKGIKGKITGKTSQGYSLKNNVESREIKVINLK